MSLARRRILGVGTLAAAVLAIVLGVTTPNPFADTTRFWAEFDSAQGLGSIDRDVRLAGVKVGTIGEVEREGDDVRVELILFEDHVIHEDARVDMRPHTLFEGSNFVDLSLGSPSADVLEEGGTIPIEQTTNYVTLDEALRVLRPEIRESLQELARVGSRTLRGEAVTGLQRLLRAAPDLAQAAAPAARAAQGSTRTELADSIQGFSRTVDAVAEREDDLIPLVQRASRTTAGLTVDGANALDTALAALPGTLRLVEETAPRATRLVDRLDGLATETTPALPALASAAREAVPVLGRAIPVLSRSTPLVADTRQLANRLAKTRGGLLEMFGLLVRPLRQFDKALVSINAETVHGAPAYRQLLAGAFAGFDGVFSGYATKAQSPNQPGHQLRIGTYVTEDAFDGFGLPRAAGTTSPAAGPVSCADVAEVSQEAARSLLEGGYCQ